MDAETDAEKTAAGFRKSSGNNPATVPIDRRRPSRAAIAPPRNPIHRVPCWTSIVEPGIPVRQSHLPTISKIGRRAIAQRIAMDTAFSAR